MVVINKKMRINIFISKTFSAMDNKEAKSSSHKVRRRRIVIRQSEEECSYRQSDMLWTE